MLTAIPAILSLLLSATPAPDTLVVCPAEFRPALGEWKAYRESQGHGILVVEPPHTSSELQALVRRMAKGGQLKYLLLIGDVATTTPSPRCVPTNYRPATVNTRWGSEPTIASDTPYGDLDSDAAPDLAVGRIPADSASELAAYFRKIVRYEQDAPSAPCERRLDVVAGAGGFGAVADAMIEAAGRHVIQQTVPKEFAVAYHPVGAPASAGQATLAQAASQARPASEDARAKIREQFRAGSLAWIYLGHGLPTELERVQTANGARPLLSVADVPAIRCGVQSPLAVLVACYTGAFDAGRDCLAEELALAEEGPIAVVAATRVTMPYGNTVFGHELLRACFVDRPPTLGDVLRLAQQRTLDAASGDSLRKSLDSVANGVSPPPVDLAAERAEHVLMYHLLGDPLLRLRLPTQEDTAIDATAGRGTRALK